MAIVLASIDFWENTDDTGCSVNIQTHRKLILELPKLRYLKNQEYFLEFLPLGFSPDVLYEFGAGADAVDFFSWRLPNE